MNEEFGIGSREGVSVRAGKITELEKYTGVS